MLVLLLRALQCYRVGQLVDAYSAFEEFAKYDPVCVCVSVV